MKVLHILQSNRFSGAENVVFQIISGLKKHNIDFIYCSRDGQIRESLSKSGIEFEPVSSMTKSEIKRVIDKVKPDIIHAHDRSASLLAAACTKNTPIIVHMHVNNNKGLKLFFKNALWTAVSRKFKHIFWVSKSSFQDFQFKNLVGKKSSILYNVMDKDVTVKKAEEASLYGCYDVIYIGRLSYQKNPERLMGVINKLCNEKKDIRIAVAGNGNYAEYIENYIKENNLSSQVDFLGYITQPLPLIRQAKVMIMTSRFEGTPMVAIEAQILGTPVVSTPVDGMVDLIENDINGYLSDIDSELVKHVLEIVENEELYGKLKQGSKEKSKQFVDVESYCETIYREYLRM